MPSPKKQKIKKSEKKRKAQEIEVLSSKVDEEVQNFFDDDSREDIQAQLRRCVMTLKVKGSSSSGIVIRANGTFLNFTPREFVIVTELNCVSNRYDYVFDENVPNRIVQKYFSGAKVIQKRQLFLAFTEKVWGENNDEDDEKFAILNFLHSFVLSNVDTKVIPRLHFDLVDSGRYKDFSWGTLSFEDLVQSLNNRLKAGGKFYLVQGMPLSIQVWLYESYSNVPKKIALKNDVMEDERSVDSDDDFQDPPLKQINECSKKKHKVDSSTPAMKKSSRKKSVNIIDDHTQKRTPAPRASKSKSQSLKDEEAVSKMDSPIDKEAFISKNVFGSFHDEVRQEFKAICKLERKKFKLMLKSIEQGKQQNEDEDSEPQHMDYDGVETSPQRFSPNVAQNLNENEDGTKISDDKADEINLRDSQFTIPGELLPSLNAYRTESITTPPSVTQQEPIDKQLNEKKLESVVEEQIMTPPKIQELSTDEQRNEPICPDTQSTISDELFPSLNTDSSKSIIVHPSRELQTPIKKLQIRESSVGNICIFPQKHPFVYHPINGIVDTKIVNKFMDWISEDLLKIHAKRVETVEDKNWFYTMEIPDQSWTDSQIDVCFYYLRKKSKYDPNKSYKFSTVDCNFMNIIRSVHDVYFVDDPNLTAGRQEAHLNEYINGLRMHAAVPWYTVEDIYISVNIKEKHHWVLVILSFSERCIFLYDSYESSSHYPAILTQIKKLAEIIPLCLQSCDFYNKKGIDLQNHPRYKEKDYSDLFDVIFEENLPQQPSERNCGVFMVTYADCLSYGHKVFVTEFDPNALCTRYAALLWDYGIRKQDANAHSDVEAPLRPARQSKITSVTEVFDV
ncbi:hypothetical protein FXO37_19237 [Capsicum annuum]|nr:hypothetical protein FXO37_19237 [Capsicum annuum]